MKAISLWQPWASAIAIGAKRIETRCWATSYRGPLAIHAAKRCVKSELEQFDEEMLWDGALNRPPSESRKPLWEAIPFGAVVAVAELVGCRRTESFGTDIDVLRGRVWAPSEFYAWTERDMGDFYPGRFGWVLTDVRPLPEPILYRGEQGLFEIPDSVFTGKE